MIRFKTLALLFSSMLMTSLSAFAASEPSGVSQVAEALFRIPGIGLPVTNSMVTSWIVAIVLIVVIRLAVRKPQLIPSRGQAVVELVPGRSYYIMSHHYITGYHTTGDLAWIEDQGSDEVLHCSAD